MATNFYKEFNRLEATLAVTQNPFQPILRPCPYTKTYPYVLAVTYWFNDRIRHSLVECLPTGKFAELEWNRGPIRLSTCYNTVIDLESKLKGLLEGGDPI